MTTAPAAKVDPGATTTLVVQLDATAAGSFHGPVSFSENADAAAFKFTVLGTVQPAVPAMSVFDNNTLLVNGTASDALGTTSAGTPLRIVLAINNAGTASLALDPQSLTLPGGFSLVTPFAASGRLATNICGEATTRLTGRRSLAGS